MSEMVTCRWAGESNPRMMNKRHHQGCESSTCAGCVACPERHCQLCARAHVTVEGAGDDQTCTDCLGATRDAMIELERLTKRLLPEAFVKGVDSEAASLAGRVIDTPEGHEAYGYRKMTEILRRDTVLEDDERHPLWVLGTWELLVREHYAQPAADDVRITIPTARAYLNGHLGRLAHDLDFAFEELARDVRACVTHLERILHEGEQEERGAPCPKCGKGALLKDYGKEAADEIRWRCTRKDCGEWCSDEDYRLKVGATYIRHADRLTATQMAEVHRIPMGTLRRWASETTRVVDGVRVTSAPRIKSIGYDPNGLKVYRVSEAVALRDGGVDQETVEVVDRTA